MDDNSVYASIVTYGASVVEQHKLQHYTNEQFRSVINGLRQDVNSGAPVLSEALRVTKQNIFNSNDDHDDLVFPDVIIIVETQPTFFTNDLDYWAQQLRSDGFTEILGVAAGDLSSYSYDVLGYIAGDVNKAVWFPDLSQLETESCVDNAKTLLIHDKTCGWYPPPPPPPTHCYQVCSDQPEPTTSTPPTSSTRGPPPTSGRPITTSTTPVRTTTSTTPTTTTTTTRTTPTTTTTTTTRTTTTTASLPCPTADLVFVVDVSDSPNHYIDVLRQFVDRISQLFFQNSRDSRAAIVIFSRTTKVVINFDSGNSYSSIHQAIYSQTAWPLIPSIRDTRLGLQVALDSVLNSAFNRPTVDDKVIVVDFGQYTDLGSNEPFTLAAQIRNMMRTTVFGFGSKPHISTKEEDPTADLTRIVNNSNNMRIFDNMDLLVDETDLRQMLGILGCRGL
jgi:hypothetical protein